MVIGYQLFIRKFLINLQQYLLLKQIQDLNLGDIQQTFGLILMVITEKMN